MTQHVLFSPLALLALCAPLLSSVPAAAQDNVAREWERRVGDWTVARYLVAGTRRLARCDWERSQPDGSLLRVLAMPGRGLVIGFASGNEALDRLGPRFAVRYWVDDAAGAQTAQAIIGPPGFARFSEPDGEPGSEDGLANGQALFIQAGQATLRFPSARSNAAFRQLFDCAGRP
ncbi:hypothetical protein [Sediminicoccus sp. KRV36]|uniref:hypothetical protein n=1 Tax=Sediminicoccus sp. KRV36 TaxID=3133721 RepID=UPI00200DE705|nr:hypothetical protein [Sediminicoccus rosea]UPY35783.1 hypothetical protein LHU95_16325 [Sediminicoccus rosea]